MARARVHFYRLLGATSIHPTCLIGHRVRLDRFYLLSIGRRCVLQDRVWLLIVSRHGCLDIGGYTFLGRDVEIEVSTSVIIGKHCLIGPGVYITDHNHDVHAAIPMHAAPCVPAPVVIGDDVWIGAKAIILPGVTIGSGSVIGAGAVVTRSVAPKTIVAGVPARLIGSRLTDA